MKEKVTAIISFLSGLGWGLFGLFLIATINNKNEVWFLIIFFLMTSTISTILYVIWTNFGVKKFSEIEKMDFENQLLKRKIEQKELKKKLDE